MSRPALPLLIGLMLTAASCEDKRTFADFQARTWDAQCTNDADCTLVPMPCDHCGMRLAITAGSADAFQEFAATVTCEDYPDRDIVCGSPAPMEPVCVSNQCSARSVEPPSADETESPEEPEDVCAELRAQTHAILESPATACESAEDCSCYPAFIDCGGVRDAASAEALVQIKMRGQEAECGYVSMDGSRFNCAPWECIPECRNGTCVRQ